MYRRHLPLALPGLVFAVGVAVSGLLVARPAIAQQPPPAVAEDNGDPWENSNRAVFEFDQSLDRAIMVPVANAYRTVLPAPVRDGIHDFLQNLGSPIIFANDVLQAQPNLAGDTLARFLINTTIGLGGTIDVATKIGIPYHTNDLGITFATWGIQSGPYMVLPVLGPSNPRDLIGDIADDFGDPASIVASQHHLIWASIARATVNGIDQRSRNIESLAEIERTSLDFYATARSLARQRRAAQIRHQKEDVPNVAPLQGASALPAPAPAKTVADLPAQPNPGMSYQFVPPNTVNGTQARPTGSR
jgi:phospholipid-binding lipoprotein MlaA